MCEATHFEHKKILTIIRHLESHIKEKNLGYIREIMLIILILSFVPACFIRIFAFVKEISQKD